MRWASGQADLPVAPTSPLLRYEPAPVDGPKAGRSLAFDNMQSRPIQGTKDWTRYDVILDVADNATLIAFGILLEGTGTVWMDDVRFEVVDASVPTTDMKSGNRKPENLNFEH